MADLTWVEAFIIDMDGVIWRGRDILEGVPEFFAYLEGNGLPYVLATNNATATPEDFAKRLHNASIQVGTDRILTSAQATAAYMAKQYPNSAKVLVIGDTGLRTAIKEAGFDIVNSASEAEAVAVGMDPTVNWQRLAEATLAIRAGAAFYGTNPDPTFPNERGQVPGNGAILAALRAASGQEPVIIGKPEIHLYQQALEKMGVAVEKMLVVGDRLETDIQGGLNLGAPTALMLTGVTDEAMAKASDIKPTYVFKDLPELLVALKRKA